MSRILSSCALGALLSVLPAQAHSSSIVQQANGTTRVTFTVRGPALGVGIVFGSTRTTNGFVLPPYGTLYLDPATGLVNLFAIPIGPAGQGSLSLTMPTAALDGLMLATQAAIVSGTSVVLSNWSGIGMRNTPADIPAGAAGDYNRETRTLTIHAYGTIGAPVAIYEKEGTHVVLLRAGQIQVDGCWMPPPIANVDLRAGDEIVVRIGNDDFTLKW